VKNIRKRVREWLRRWRRRRAAKRERDAPLREFVYLDEVSVYSLIASRLGAVATEFTATESSSLRGEVSSSVGVSAGVAKSNIGSQTEATQGSGSQVVRKSVVQSTFKELVEIEQESMALRPSGPNARAPQVQLTDDLLALASDATDRWVVDPRSLGRGQLVEIEVELEAEAIFRVSAILSTLLEIIQENPELANFGDPQGILQAVAANRVLDQLLVGLVPLRGVAVHYSHVTLGGRELLVHQQLLEQLPNTADLEIHPFEVVGVAEAALFWRDIRRVLFSRSRYVVLGRLARDGVHRDWTPVKLVEVLRDVAPELAGQIDNAGEGLLTAMRHATALEGDAPPARDRMKTALINYANALAVHYGKICTEQDLVAQGLPTEEQCDSYSTLETRRSAFNVFTEHLEQTLELPNDRRLAGEYRFAALSEAGLGIDGEVSSAPDVEQTTTSPQSANRYLDTEIVAIYW